MGAPQHASYRVVVHNVVVKCAVRMPKLRREAPAEQAVPQQDQRDLVKAFEDVSSSSRKKGAEQH